MFQLSPPMDDWRMRPFKARTGVGMFPWTETLGSLFPYPSSWDMKWRYCEGFWLDLLLMRTDSFGTLSLLISIAGFFPSTLKRNELDIQMLCSVPSYTGDSQATGPLLCRIWFWDNSTSAPHDPTFRCIYALDVGIWLFLIRILHPSSIREVDIVNNPILYHSGKILFVVSCWRP